MDTPKIDKLLDSASASLGKQVHPNTSHDRVVELTFEVAHDAVDAPDEEILSWITEDPRLATETTDVSDVEFDGQVAAVEVVRHNMFCYLSYMLHQGHYDGQCNEPTCALYKSDP